MFAVGYDAGVTIHRSKIQFEELFFLAGQHDFSDLTSSAGPCGSIGEPACQTDATSIPLDKGTEIRLTFAQFLKPHLALKVEYRRLNLDFERELYNNAGQFDQRSRAIAFGLTFIH
jgi:hypothetical protein